MGTTTRPTTTHRDEQPYVGITEQVTMEQFATVADHLPWLVQWLDQQGVDPAGPVFFRYHSIDMEGRSYAVEAGVPVAADVVGRLAEVADDADQPLDLDTLPAGEYATLSHHGHPDGLFDATSELLSWADGQGLEFDRETDDSGAERWGCRLEVYLSHPEEVPDLADWDTELVFRLLDRD